MTTTESGERRVIGVLAVAAMLYYGLDLPLVTITVSESTCLSTLRSAATGDPCLTADWKT